MEFKKFDCQVYTYEADFIICPCCGAVQEDYAFDPDESYQEIDMECQNEDCGKAFLLTPKMSFTTVRVDEDGLVEDDRPITAKIRKEETA